MVNTDQHITSVLEQIRQSLKSLDPYKIILFGSYARGTANKDSDCDLLVILDSNKIPDNFREKMQLHSRVAKRLRHLRRKIPMDIIVQTRPLYKQFIRTNSIFARDIQQNGKVIYEKHNQRVA